MNRIRKIGCNQGVSMSWHHHVDETRWWHSFYVGMYAVLCDVIAVSDDVSPRYLTRPDVWYPYNSSVRDAIHWLNQLLQLDWRYLQIWWRHHMVTGPFFARDTHRSPVDSTHVGRVMRSFDVSLPLIWKSCCKNSRKSGHLRHRDAPVMSLLCTCYSQNALFEFNPSKTTG